MLFASPRLQAQIKPFEDYSKCMTGFLKYSGDTLYKAQFENVQPLYGFIREGKLVNAWMVEFSGRKGCIDESGMWIFECEYTDLNYDHSSQLFFAKKNDGAGVFKSNGEVVLPCQFDDVKLQTGYFNYFETEHEGMDRAYNMDGKAITPECDYVELQFLWSIDSAGKWKAYFVCHKSENGKSFNCVNDETGKEIPFPGLTGLEMLFFEGQVAEDELIFLVSNDNDEIALADKNGKNITRFFGPEVELYPIQLIEPGSRFITYRYALVNSYVKDEEKTIILNLKTGAESEVYDEVLPFGDYFVAYRKKEALVLDKDFNLLFRTSTKYKTLTSFDIEGSNNLHPIEGFTSISPWVDGSRRFLGSQKAQDQCDEVIILKTEEFKSGKDKKTHSLAKSTYQIIQTKTGKLVEKKYDDVRRAINKDGVYLWAMNQSKNKDSISVDIFSYDGVFQRSVLFTEDQRHDIKKQLAYSRYYSDQNDQAIWISDDSGKYKAVGHNGASITPFAFERISRVIFSTNDKWVFCEGNYEEGIYYNELHEPLFNGEQVTDLKPFNDRRNFFVATDKLGYLLNERFEIIEDSLSWFQFQYSKDVLKIPETNFPTFQKNGFCYACINGKILLLDSTVFLHPQKYNQLHPSSFKIEANGKFYIPEKKTDVRENDIIGNLVLVLNSGTLTITDKSTSKVVNVIRDVERFLYDHKQSVMVELTSHKQGLLDYKTGKWCVEPKYTEVKDLTASYQQNASFFWAREEGKNDGKWFPMDVNGKLLAPAIFDEAITRPSKNYNMPFKSYGKIGLINENFKIVAQPIFDKSVFQDNIRAYFKDDKPYLVFPNGKMMEIKHPISDAYVSKNFLFLYNDSIEVISNEGTVLLPAMPLEKAMKTYLLAEYLYLPPKNKRTFPYISNDHVFCAPTDLAMRYYSNHVFIDDIRGSMKEVKDLATPRPMSLSYTFRIQCDVEPTWISKNLCSERVHGKCFPESAYKRQDFDSGSGYRVYKIMKDTCIQLRLEDLIKDDVVATQKLDDLIRIEIQKKQSFGLVCADMEGAIAAFKSDFSVDQQYLFMRNQGLTEYLAIPIRDLKDILRNPEWFEN